MRVGNRESDSGGEDRFGCNDTEKLRIGLDKGISELIEDICNEEYAASKCVSNWNEQ